MPVGRSRRHRRWTSPPTALPSPNPTIRVMAATDGPTMASLAGEVVPREEEEDMAREVTEPDGVLADGGNDLGILCRSFFLRVFLFFFAFCTKTKSFKRD